MPCGPGSLVRACPWKKGCLLQNSSHPLGKLDGKNKLNATFYSAIAWKSIVMKQQTQIGCQGLGPPSAMVLQSIEEYLQHSRFFTVVVTCLTSLLYIYIPHDPMDCAASQCILEGSTKLKNAVLCVITQKCITNIRI